MKRLLALLVLLALHAVPDGAAQAAQPYFTPGTLEALREDYLAARSREESARTAVPDAQAELQRATDAVKAVLAANDAAYAGTVRKIREAELRPQTEAAQARRDAAFAALRGVDESDAMAGLRRKLDQQRLAYDALLALGERASRDDINATIRRIEALNQQIGALRKPLLDRIAAIDAELAALEKARAEPARQAELARLQQELERNIQLPTANDPTIAAWIVARVKAAAALRTLAEAQSAVTAGFAAYTDRLLDASPPYLMRVEVRQGDNALVYRAFWVRRGKDYPQGEVDDLAKFLRDKIVELDQALRDYDGERRYLAGGRLELAESMRKLLERMDYWERSKERWELLLGLSTALVEVSAVVVDLAISGGTLTLANAANSVADAIWDKFKTQTAKKLTATAASKWASYGSMKGYLEDALQDQGYDHPGASIFVADAAEQAYNQAAGLGIEAIQSAVTGQEGDRLGEALTQARSLIKQPTLANLKDAMKPSLSTVIAVAATSVKLLLARQYGERIANAEEQYIKAFTDFRVKNLLIRNALVQDRQLFNTEQDLRRKRAFWAGMLDREMRRRYWRRDRDLTVEDPETALRIELTFSSFLAQAPIVTLDSIFVSMTPLGPPESADRWVGTLPVKELLDTPQSGQLWVALPLGSKPFSALDSKPASTARVDIADHRKGLKAPDLRWTDYERGPDLNHRIKLRLKKPDKPKPADEVGQGPGRLGSGQSASAPACGASYVELPVTGGKDTALGPRGCIICAIVAVNKAIEQAGAASGTSVRIGFKPVVARVIGGRTVTLEVTPEPFSPPAGLAPEERARLEREIAVLIAALRKWRHDLTPEEEARLARDGRLDLPLGDAFKSLTAAGVAGAEGLSVTICAGEGG